MGCTEIFLDLPSNLGASLVFDLEVFAEGFEPRFRFLEEDEEDFLSQGSGLGEGVQPGCCRKTVTAMVNRLFNTVPVPGEVVEQAPAETVDGVSTHRKGRLITK